jgi:hypothetical protein
MEARQDGGQDGPQQSELMTENLAFLRPRELA